MAIEKEILTWRLSDAIATISEPSTDPPHHATYRCKDQHVPQRDQYILALRQKIAYGTISKPIAAIDDD